MSRVVVITGASRGLGLELAKKFTSDGDRIYGISRTKTHWPSAKAAVPSGDFKLLKADISSEKDVRALTAKIGKEAGHIDLLINNAGYCGPLTRVEDASAKELRAHLEQNLVSAFLMCKHAIPLMKKSPEALIINVSSMAGTRAVPRLFPYSAAKFGVLALSQAIAKENEGAGLKCITVCPGGMNTKMRRDLFGVEDAEKQQGPDFVAYVIDQIVQGRIEVLSGGHIIIRHGKITGVFPPPAP